jgi:SNF2 family DNA or RNA helicase
MPRVSSKRSSVINPLTNRQVKVGSSVHKKLSKEGWALDHHVSEKKLPLGRQLKPHQRAVVDHLRKHRGLIAIHSVGSGKTLAAVAFSQMYLEEINPLGTVYVVTPASLENNFRKEMLAYLPDITFENYVFLSYAMFNQRFKAGKISCDKCAIIIDEAHNLRTKITDKGGVIVASMMKFAKTAQRVLLLTATPFVNGPYDIANLVAIVRNNTPRTEVEFGKIMSNPRFIQNYFANTISIYGDSSSINADYPKFKVDQVFIEMSREYFKLYTGIEWQIGETIDGFENPTIFYNGLRRASNKINDTIEAPKMKWISNFFNIFHQSGNAQSGNAPKTVIFSNWIEFGTRAIEEILYSLSIPYGIISGDISASDRNNFVNRYNSGEINVLIITRAGSEGLDLKETKFVIITDPGWNSALDEQIIGRAVRYKSHEGLPEEERFVQVYKLFLIKPMEKRYINAHPLRENDLLPVMNDTYSIDMFLRNKIIEKKKENIRTMRLLKEISI